MSFIFMDAKKELQILGKKLKAARTKKGLSQMQLAHEIGKDHPSINRVERGKINPSYLYLLEVCEGLEISLSELLTEF